MDVLDRVVGEGRGGVDWSNRGDDVIDASVESAGARSIPAGSGSCDNVVTISALSVNVLLAAS